jgi:hypothetical protein
MVIYTIAACFIAAKQHAGALMTMWGDAMVLRSDVAVFKISWVSRQRTPVPDCPVYLRSSIIILDN